MKTEHQWLWQRGHWCQEKVLSRELGAKTTQREAEMLQSAGGGQTQGQKEMKRQAQAEPNTGAAGVRIYQATPRDRHTQRPTNCAW